MGQKIAVAIVHGAGRLVPTFADAMSAALRARCQPCGDDLVTRPVHWAAALQDSEDELWRRMQHSGLTDLTGSRRFLIDFMADAIAYQITPHDRYAYNAIHTIFAETLRALAQDAGPDAPLCVIGHSLGTIIASNYLYDLQKDPSEPILPLVVRETMGETPLEKGETLTLFYTLGSPLALWSLRFRDFGRPITVPDPRLRYHYPRLSGEWANLYDRDDVVAFPLKTLNDAYRLAVTEDYPVNTGHLFTGWNPASHMYYWTNRQVIDRIAQGLSRVWQAVNQD